MVIPILCLVCLCLVAWVMLLKAEIYRLTLKYEGNKGAHLTSKANTLKGNRTFEVD